MFADLYKIIRFLSLFGISNIEMYFEKNEKNDEYILIKEDNLKINIAQ